MPADGREARTASIASLLGYEVPVAILCLSLAAHLP